MAVLNWRCFRYPLLFLVCIVEFLWIAGARLANARWKKLVWLTIVVCTIVVVWLCTLDTGIYMKGQYTRWLPSAKPVKERTSNHFVEGAYDEIFMYSAIANDALPHSHDLTIVITSLDQTYNRFQCCFVLDNHTLYTTPAHEYFSHYANTRGFWVKFTKRYDPGRYRAHQHSCFLPNEGHHASHVMLTSSQCSPNPADYVPITYPPKRLGEIALCAKIAHGGGIDPEKFIEWVEVQRILGVDKIQIYDLGNPPPLTQVFQYYKALGVLDVLPYELPGLPRRRSLHEKYKRTIQFSHDETMAVMDCRQRMGGYTYILSHDVDEFLIPRKDIDLKEFLKKKMESTLDAAGFMFYTEFFIYNWGPSHSKEDLMVTRYQEATTPHWECTKYAILPSRVHATQTHTVYPHKPFIMYDIPHSEVVLHHYRRCPDDVWHTCHPPTIKDPVMARFARRHWLYERVVQVRQATNIKPGWVIE